MEIWRVPYKLQILSAGGGERSPGVHLSDVIRDLALRGKQLDMKYAGRENMRAERIELGIAWEERLPKHHPEICFHPGEIVCDGVAMTIDGNSECGGEPSLFHPTGADLRSVMTASGKPLASWQNALHEFKLTWKSSRGDILTNFMWMAQGACYLHGLSEELGEKIRTTFWHVFWVNGNYARNDADPESGPSYHIYGVQLSDLEVRENWDMVRRHRDRMETPGDRVSLTKFMREE